MFLKGKHFTWAPGWQHIGISEEVPLQLGNTELVHSRSLSRE